MSKNKIIFICIAVSAIFLAAAINIFFIINAYVPSSSMSPVIEKGSMVLGSRRAYMNDSPKVGDIIFFKKDSVSDHTLVKRIVALPGQRFSMKNGHVYIDGVILDEPYVSEFSTDYYAELYVPEDSYIVLGDNRSESNDSRFWNDPFVRKSDIKAKANYIWFPKFKKLDTE